MSSKRAVRRRQCKGKHRFANAEQAQAAISALRRTRGPQGHLTPYHCRFCGGYHFGHTPGQARFA